MIRFDLSADALAEMVASEYITGSQSMLMRAVLRQIIAMTEKPALGKPYTTLERINRIARDALG